ncbi:hypothetical protein PpBr36_07280 [Pyricularia pennisetigena]|uniref:hypothetical protein n=1 Tax=Pyricularia pennisetigena TaxID=1578925 RepID=UPI0011533775|nr:hypothetical protein PpBr36_07280 [Pyricularia pennisetigena]TLS25704.1 hypothetical protein PpBr36_07280 [Pyricularia pennisetigena]
MSIPEVPWNPTENSLIITLEEALLAHRAALALCDHISSDALPQPTNIRHVVLPSLGYVYQMPGRLTSALERIEEAERNLPRDDPGRLRALGELAVVYRHFERLGRRQAGYEAARKLGLEHEMERAVGNLGMLNYQLFLVNGNRAYLDLAIRRLRSAVEVPGGPCDMVARVQSATAREAIAFARLPLCYTAESDRARAIEAAVEGHSALDYAVYNGDELTQNMLIEALRQQLSHEEVKQHRLESTLRKGQRELFQDILRPVLLQPDKKTSLSQLRRAYADTLGADQEKARQFDKFECVRFGDFARCGRLPKGTGNWMLCFGDDADGELFVIFMSYTWANENPCSGCEISPDNERNTKYHHMISAVQSFLEAYGSSDWACINQLDRDIQARGVAALPISLARCNAMISITDNKYYEQLHITEGSDGGVVHITKNLAQALRRLRLSHEPRTLWVDAICINQDDTEERGRQVAMMQAIFGSCERCLAWLGPFSHGDEKPRRFEMAEEEYMASAMEFFERIAVHDIELLGSKKETAETIASLPYGRPSHLDPNKEYYLLSSTETVMLSFLFRRAKLWDRAWCVQELACSPRLVLVAGGARLAWDRVGSFLSAGHYSDAFHGSFGHGWVRPIIAQTFSSPKRIQEQREILQDAKAGKHDDGSAGASSLMDVLARFRHLESTDPRDMVFGLLGLVDPSLRVPVDYAKSTVEVFIQTTAAIISSRANLDAICQNPWFSTCKDARPEGLPSWAVDFASQGTGDLIFAQRGIFAAGRRRCETPCQVVAGVALKCRGRRFGSPVSAPGVDTANDRFPAHMGPEEVIAGARRLGYLEQPDKVYPATGERATQALWRTLVMDCVAYPVRRLTAEQVEKETESLDEMVGKVAALPKDTSWRDKEKLYRRLESYMMFRRNRETWYFFTTDDGRFALGGKEVRGGDLVAVLDGAKVPVVLRPTGESVDGVECFRFVSPAYVHGSMDGEEVDGPGTQDLLLV